MNDGYVVSLADGGADATQMGGKGASLVRLIDLGHRVPPGFVITVDAFDAAIEAAGAGRLREELSRSVAAGAPRFELGDEIAAALEAAPFPGGVHGSLTAAIDALRLWELTTGDLIVRSSATAEDSATASFAGIFESIRVTRPQDLEATVKAVWSSVFARRALSYATETGATEIPAMALVVQAFIEAERSGVMFTTFDGDRTLIEHVEGGCEKLVKGEVIPERLWIDRGSRRPEGDQRGLTADQVASLGALAADLESQFGGPQDVEWCLYEGEVHLVQTRPITAGLAAVEASAVPGALLAGVAASRGIAVGKVHLAHNIDQALALEVGRVLVTPMTNPDMVVAMRNSAGIVTDVGGMICHAAIVSRELGLPCVVGTESATTTVIADQTVTVDGWRGCVFDGAVDLVHDDAGLRPATWADVWARWTAAPLAAVPIVSTVDAIAAAPPDLDRVALRPDIDLRTDAAGLWADLDRMDPQQLAAFVRGYLERVVEAASAAGIGRLELVTSGLPTGAAECLAAAACDGVGVVDDVPDGAPLAAALVDETQADDPRAGLAPLRAAQEAARDTVKFFGHRPGVVRTTMPAAGRRAMWWELLPEYGRFHREWRTAEAGGEHDWLEVRPELVISALLKSLVQPGFEMVPRVLGFSQVPPLHIKWVRCRYHFRSDAFADVWRAVVDATWDEDFMADLMHRVRESYHRLAEVLVLFPDDEDLARLSGAEIVALITSWWPRWVEFFALCWFIQAQGDDILYPFIEETVNANVDALRRASPDVAWPTAFDLVLPTCPVMSGDYMASVGRLRDALVARGLTTTEAALRALDTGAAPDIASLVAEHLAAWHWMRDRDLIFEPWDTPERVIETALRTEGHIVVDYAANLRRNVFGLSVHGDLAETSCRAGALRHAVRFLHDLNVERENHHVLWLRYSYPLRRLFLEVERRLVATGSITTGDVWFLQAPELITAVQRLPEPIDPDVAALVANRRHGFEHEARFSGGDEPVGTPEDDYL